MGEWKMTNNEVIFEAKRLIERIKLKYPDFVGKTATESDLAKLEKELQLKLPEWYIELYTTVPLINAEFGIQEDEHDEDYDGVSYIIWGGVDDIFDESTKYEPGISVLEDGFVFLASCSHGSGDPIYVKLSSKQQSVFRIYHDDHSKNQLAEDLTSLFKNAII
jgi:hypothetical protein